MTGAPAPALEAVFQQTGVCRLAIPTTSAHRFQPRRYAARPHFTASPRFLRTNPYQSVQLRKWRLVLLAACHGVAFGEAGRLAFASAYFIFHLSSFIFHHYLSSSIRRRRQKNRKNPPAGLHSATIWYIILLCSMSSIGLLV